jgi:hypothetical protein
MALAGHLLAPLSPLPLERQAVRLREHRLLVLPLLQLLPGGGGVGGGPD